MFAKRVKLLSALAGIIIFLLLSQSCNDNEGQPGHISNLETGKNQTNPNSEKLEGNSELYPITFTALLTDRNAKVKWGKDPVSREITKKTGVTLELEILKGNLIEKMGVMLASDSYPDILFSVTNEVVAKFSEAGALYPLDDYIDDYGGNIKEVFGEDLAIMRTEWDGKIYGFNRKYKGISSRSDAVFHVQYHMLMEYGYPKIKTLDDLYSLMKSYKEKYPQYNGMDTLGLSAFGDSWGMNVTFNNPALRAGGYQNDGNYLVDQNLDVKYGLTTDTAKHYLKWLNKLNREGLFDRESLVQDRELFVSKISSGRVLVTTTEYWDMADSEAFLRKQGLNDRCYAKLPLVLSEDIESKISNYDPTGLWKTVITKKCKNPIRAFKFFNLMWSEEMQILCNWGVEGVHYTINDGKRVLKPEILEMRNTDPDWKSKTGISIYNMCSVGENVKGKDGQYIIPFDTPESIIEEQDELTRKILKEYNVRIWKDLCPEPKPSPWGFAWKLVLPQNTPGANAEIKVNEEIRRKAIPRIVMAGNDEEFDYEWNNFVKATENAGLAQREAEIKFSLQKRMELWK